MKYNQKTTNDMKGIDAHVDGGVNISPLLPSDLNFYDTYHYESNSIIP